MSIPQRSIFAVPPLDRVFTLLFIDADGVAGRQGRINFTETKRGEGEQRRWEGLTERERERERKRKGIKADHRLMFDGHVLSRRRSNNGLQQRPPRSAELRNERADDETSFQACKLAASFVAESPCKIAASFIFLRAGEGGDEGERGVAGQTMCSSSVGFLPSFFSFFFFFFFFFFTKAGYMRDYKMLANRSCI